LAGYSIVFPDYFDDEAPIIESKGWFGDLVVEIGSKKVELTFYDPYRLIQHLKEMPSEDALEWFGNLVVVSVVNRSSIEDAVKTLYARGLLGA
jgi:hypothetical protein